MLLQSLTLQNIRSYTSQTLIFPTGSVLLAGDIGSGKSSLLLAIEFALFGASRTDLPAELLLRKGTAQGAVELQFLLEGKKIIIQRTLKREKDTVKQTSGYLIIDGIKKELMSQELKAEMLNLLGYPPEALAKSKNYLFRYTVYTPQEEMKLILQEDAELRLDTLRKIFNVDKYKTIQENVQIYLKSMRIGIAMLNTKLGPLEEKKKREEQVEEEQQRMEQALGQVQLKYLDLQRVVQQRADEIVHLEQKQKIVQEKQEQYTTVLVIIKEKQEQLQRCETKIHEAQRTLRSIIIPEGFSSEKAQQEVEELERSKEEIVRQSAQLEEKIRAVQGQIAETRKIMAQRSGEIVLLAEKEQLLQVLGKDMEQVEGLLQKKEQLEDLYLKTAQVITRNETLLSQSLELQQKIVSLDVCPTCLQQVTREHKHRIAEEEGHKNTQAENILFELKKRREIILEQLREARGNIEELKKKESLIHRLTLDVSRLREKKELVAEKQALMTQLLQENNKVMAEFTSLQKESKIAQINALLKKKKETINHFIELQHVQQQEKEWQQQQGQIQEQLGLVLEQRTRIELEMLNTPDLTATLKESRKVYLEFLTQEKEGAVQLAQLQTTYQASIMQLQELRQEVQQLMQEKNKLVRIQQIYHWLEDHFLKLTSTIEKQVMVNIHYHFNQLFQEWCALLIDDESISSRLDDSCTPLIEQNGHDVSFAYLSGGEKTCAALAYRLALNKVINDVVHSMRTKDLLILDEPTDGFSTEQLDKVREVLERLKLQQIIVVSHESKIETFVDTVIRVQKQGHVSEII